MLSRGESKVWWVETTLPQAGRGSDLHASMVRRGLAACANVATVDSVYHWKGKLEQEGERLVVFKTSAAAREALMAAIRAEHPYELPYLAWGAMQDVDAAYASWVVDSCQGRGSIGNPDA